MGYISRSSSMSFTVMANAARTGVSASLIGLDSKPNMVDMVGTGLSGVGARRGSIGALFLISSSGMCKGDRYCSDLDRPESSLNCGLGITKSPLYPLLSRSLGNGSVRIEISVISSLATPERRMPKARLDGRRKADAALPKPALCFDALVSFSGRTTPCSIESGRDLSGVRSEPKEVGGGKGGRKGRPFLSLLLFRLAGTSVLRIGTCRGMSGDPYLSRPPGECCFGLIWSLLSALLELLLALL
mmetsp:Transcript_12673/g.31906  ORF Transcript_12673/g.31906 Transcript_12673/m.31906 type:complete len:244 (-) Transcript_12673:464-1195(-)